MNKTSDSSYRNLIVIYGIVPLSTLDDEMQIIRKNRDGRIGGMCLYFKTNIMVQKIHINLNTASFQYLVGQIRSDKRRTIVCIIYRPYSLKNLL